MNVAKPGFRLPYGTYLNKDRINLLFPSHQTTGVSHIGICESTKPFYVMMFGYGVI